jgi:general nucleoside transport system permease protein
MKLRTDTIPRGLRIAGQVAATGAALLIVLSVLLWSVDRDVAPTLAALVRSGFGDQLGLTETLVRMTPLLLCALAVALPAKAGLFNIGAEGQLHAGATAAAGVALFGTFLPPLAVLPSMVASAVVAGALWGLIPGWLRGRWGVNEVLVGLMLNYVAILLVQHLVHGPWKDPGALGWPYTAHFPAAAKLPTLGASNVHFGLIVAIGGCLLAWVLLRSTTWGMSLRVIEAAPRAARHLEIPLVRHIAVALAFGAVFAALAGLGEVSVVQGRLRPGISAGYGYAGFLVAWLAGNHLLLLVPVSFVVAGLYAGSDALQLTSGLPSATADVFMGLVFVAVLWLRAGRRTTP